MGRSCSCWVSLETLSIVDLGRKVVTLMALAYASRCSNLVEITWDRHPLFQSDGTSIRKLRIAIFTKKNFAENLRTHIYLENVIARDLIYIWNVAFPAAYRGAIWIRHNGDTDAWKSCLWLQLNCSHLFLLTLLFTFTYIVKNVS